MLEEDFEREIKVLLVGNGGVGKTSMIRRFCRGAYTDEYKKTIGVDFLEKNLYVESLGEECRMMLWDTAGQEEFDSMTRAYYRGAGACVLTFSTVDRESFKSVTTWKKKVEAECGDIPMVLVQNKVDLIDQAAMTPEEAENLARTLGLKFYRSCVKENMNVTQVFKYLAELNAKMVQTGQWKPARPAAAAPSRDKAGDKEVGGETFTLGAGGPSKKRTGGKKKLKHRLGAACSVL